MPRKRAVDIYEQIRPYVDQYAREHYNGSEEEGFRHWAFNERFLELAFSDTDITDMTNIDGPDDFEVDGYHVDDTEDGKVIYLFQSKYRAPGTSMGSKELSAFLDAPVKLLNPEMVVSCHNEETKNLHDLLVKLIPLDYSLNLVWVTSGTLSLQGRAYASSLAAQTIPVPIAGTVHNAIVTFEALDLRDLVNLFQTHQESEALSSCNWTFNVQPARCHEVVGQYKTILLTLPAKEIIQVYGQYNHKLMRLNPRGPLGNKINANMKRTLLDPGFKHIFHVLNNGISAICGGYALDGTSLTVTDFQIVNGCQTTVTLWNARAAIQNDPEILVNVKLVECPEILHKKIAATTNTQAPLRAEDFISTEPIQIALQRQFDSLSPPWFYQVKRSEWSRMLGGPRQKEKYLGTDGTYRWLKSKDVAQALVAFMGFPGEAKDKIRFFFDGKLSSEVGELSYKEIYKPGIDATQLLLAASIYERLTSRVNQDKALFSWLDYARLHLLWLVGEVLRSKYQVPRDALFDKNLAQRLIHPADDWLQPLYLVARVAIANAVQNAQQGGTYSGHREFFRSPVNYQAMKGNLPNALSIVSLAGSDPLAKLPHLS